MRENETGSLPPAPAADELLTPEELVKRWKYRVTVGTLAKWRTGAHKVGPGFIRLYPQGPVLYPLLEVVKYERSNAYVTTRERRA